MSLTERNFTVICEECDEEFKSKAANAKRCSEPCRRIALKRLADEKEKPEPNTNMTSKSRPTIETMARSNEWLMKAL